MAKLNRGVAGAAALAVMGFCGGSVAEAASNPTGLVVWARCGVPGAPTPEERDECRNLVTISDGSVAGWKINGTVELVSGGVVVSTESNPVLVSDPGNGRVKSLGILLTGNGNANMFNLLYADPVTSVLTAPDLSVRVYSNGVNGQVLVANQRYAPQGSAVWAKHSEDTPALQTSINAETARAKAAEAAITGNLGIEAQTRGTADINLNQIIGNETSRAQSSEGFLQFQIDQIKQGNANFNAALAAEIAARKQGDADTLAAAKIYTDMQVAAEAKTRGDADTKFDTEMLQLNLRLNNEVNRAMNAEQGLKNDIHGVDIKLGVVAADLVNETAARKQADANLDQQILGETARAQMAEATLANNLNAEINRAQMAEAGLAPASGSPNYIQNQYVAAQAADAWISGKLRAQLGIYVNNANTAAIDGNRAGNFTTGTQVTGGGNVQTLFSVSNTGNAFNGNLVELQQQVPATGNYMLLKDSGGAPKMTVSSAGNVTIAGTFNGNGGGLSNVNAVRLQTRNVSNAAPAVGQVLGWDGAQWVPTASNAGNINGMGVANTITKWTGAGSIGNSGLIDNGMAISTGETFSAASLTAPMICYAGDCRTSWNNQDANSVNPLPRSCPAG